MNGKREKGKGREIEKEAEERSSQRWATMMINELWDLALAMAANKEARTVRTMVRRRRGEKEEREGEIRDEMGTAARVGELGYPSAGRGGFSTKCHGYFCKIVRLPCSCENKITIGFGRVYCLKGTQWTKGSLCKSQRVFLQKLQRRVLAHREATNAPNSLV
jgi:hypothetical protein